MKLSQSFVKTLRQVSSEEKSINAQLLLKGGFVSQLMAGVYTYLPMGLRVLHKIEQIVREEMNKIGGEEILMPSLQPKANWEQTGRYESIDVMFKFLSYYTKIEYVLGSTHEEIVTPLLQNYILSYKDLPRQVYQIQSKFRDEKRAKSGIMRGREFLMKDLYSFHASQTDLDEYYEKAICAYNNVYDRLGIGDKTYLTYASGGTFSKYSHEFQTITDAGEDIVYICDKCKVGINKEIYEEQNVCPVCGSGNLKEMKTAEVGNIFKLGTKFSDAFNFKYTDKDGSLKSVIMGCYGIGIGRCMGTVVEVSHDDKGIIWPESIAPYRYVVIGIGEEGYNKASEIYDHFNAKGVEVVWDDRDESAGFKFKDADLIGYPYQIVVSAKTMESGNNMVELVNRKTGEKSLIDFKTL